MKKVVAILLAVFVFVLPVISYASVYVHGYYRSNGTYVAPHYRSNPDGNPYNNYSYPGNTNPYTGVTATGNSDTYLKNYYKSTSTPSLSSYSSVSSSSYEKISGGHKSYGILFCDSGYYESGNNCRPVPANSTAGIYSFYCNSGYVLSSDGESCESTAKMKRAVPYVVKTWVENNPYTSCMDSTFLRNKERQLCDQYKEKIDKYDWFVTKSEFDNKYYRYDSVTDSSYSCPDKYKFLVENGKITDKCTPEK